MAQATVLTDSDIFTTVCSKTSSLRVYIMHPCISGWKAHLVSGDNIVRSAAFCSLVAAQIWAEKQLAPSPPESRNMTFSNFSLKCGDRLVAEPARSHPGKTALRIEFFDMYPRCRLKTPEHWTGDKRSLSIRWLWSGGDPTVFGECCQKCPIWISALDRQGGTK